MHIQQIKYRLHNKTYIYLIKNSLVFIKSILHEVKMPYVNHNIITWNIIDLKLK